MKKNHLFLITILLFSTNLFATKTTVTYSTGSPGTFTPTIASLDATIIDTLVVVSAISTDYLTLSDMRSINGKFKSKSNATFTIDLSQAVFLNNSIPSATSGNGAFDVIGTYNASTNPGFHSLKEVILPTNIRVIGNYAFRYCRYLAKINLNEGLEIIGIGTFAQPTSYSNTALNLTSLPSTVVSIGDNAFYFCNNVKLSSFPTNFSQTVLSGTFRSTSVSISLIPEGVTGILSQTFDCGHLDRAKITSINFPSTLTSLASNAFGIQTKITYVEFKSSTPPTVTGTLISGTSFGSAATIIVPQGALSAYQGAASFSGFTFVEKIPTFAGSGNWSETAKWNTGALPGASSEVTLNGDVTIDTNIAIKGLTINSAKSVTIKPGMQLTISDSFTNNGTIILESDATGTATIKTPETISGSGTAQVQQYLPSTRSWYISAPVSGVNATVPIGSTYFGYSESGDNLSRTVSGETDYWKAYTEGSTLEVGKGYIAQPASTKTVTFRGSLISGNKNFSLSRTVGKQKEGFNLVGNPYPSYLNWDNVTKTDVSNTMWYRTHDGSSYKFYTYNTVDGAGGIGVPATITNLIPPMQAFWVRVEAGHATGSIGLTNTMREHQDVSGNGFRGPRIAETTNQLLRLQISNGVNTDETVLYFNANASDDFDRYDSPKMFNTSTSIPEIFTQVGTEQLVINGLNEIKYDTEIPLGFSTLQPNNFSIIASEFNNFDANTIITLKDKELKTEQDLTNGTVYNFESGITNTNGRFSLLFRALGTTTDINNKIQFNTRVFVNAQNQITILGVEKSSFAIYNILGQKQFESILGSSQVTINKVFCTGVYFAHTYVNGQREIQKITIR